MLAGALAYALGMVWHGLQTSGWESITVLLALGLIMSWHVLCAIPHKADLPYRLLPFGVVLKRPKTTPSIAVVTKIDSYIAWGLLAIFAIIALLPFDLSSDWRFAFAFFFLILSPACYLLGKFSALLLAGPFFIFIVMLPLQETLFLIISQPLRLIATMLSVETLKLFGTNVSYHLTTISLPNVNLGITDACSGIQQFEALLLLGYLLVRWQQDKLIWRILHYAFIIASVVIANTIRLMSIVVLYNAIGPRVLEPDWHEGMGYAQVILAILILWLFGLAITALNPADDSHAKNASKGGDAQ